MNNEKLPLCKYALNCSQGSRVLVKCTITKDFCPKIRWCPVHNCPRMNEKYESYGCGIEIKEDIKRKEGGN